MSREVVMKAQLRTFGAPAWLLTLTILLPGCAAAHGGPVIDSGDKPPELSGTISGIVRAAGSNAPISARRVTAIEATTGMKHETSTASNGGYTMKVPVGRYRIALELQPDEAIVEAPSDVNISRSDLDAGRDFLVAVKR
jgi:hypothetical protein